VQYGLGVDAIPTRTNVRNTQTIGVAPTRIALNPAAGYSVKAAIISGTFALNTATGSTSGTTAWSAGTNQVETATASGTASASASVVCTVTSAGMVGSPLAVTVPITSGDTASVWAGKVRTALAANATIAARFTVSGSGATIVLTRTPLTSIGISFPFPNDATLNIALANGSPSPGITAAATSADTTAGVAPSGVYTFDPAVDFEGKALPTIKVKGWSIQSDDTIEINGGDLVDKPLDDGDFLMEYSSQGLLDAPAFSITATDAAVVTITVIGDLP
jgi:hypothetical protein